MSQACIAVLLATTLAAPAVGPVEARAPVEASAPAQAPAPVEAPAPAQAPAPAEAATPTIELTPAAAPASTVEPAPVAAVPLVAAPSPRVDPERARAQRTADGLTITGAIIGGFGGATLLLVAAPTHALYRRSLDRAESARWVTEQDRFIDDAHRRRSIMLTSAAVGAGLTAIGTVLLATGLARRARLRSPAAATLSIAPAVGGGTYGVGASMRF